MAGLRCYTVGDNFVTWSNQYYACGTSDISGAKAQNCCFAQDFCMEDGICHYTHFVTNGTGYYMGGCTDPTWQDPACRRQCLSEYGQDIVYDTTNRVWHCCDVTSTEKNCRQPSDFIFDAPAPNDLQTVTQLTETIPPVTTSGVGSITSLPVSTSGVPRSVSSSSMTASQSHSKTAVATPSNPSPAANSNGYSSNGDGLGKGGLAGVVVGAAAGLILLGLAFLFWDRRRDRAKAQAKAQAAAELASDEKKVDDAAHGMEFYGPTAKTTPEARAELPDAGVGSQTHPNSSGYPTIQKQSGYHAGYQDQRTPAEIAAMQREANPQELSTQENSHELGTDDIRPVVDS